MHNYISIQIFIVYNRLSYQRETFFLTCDFTQIQQTMYKIKKNNTKILLFIAFGAYLKWFEIRQIHMR